MRWLLLLLLVIPAAVLAEEAPKTSPKLPDVNLKGLKPAQVAFIGELFTQGACPCQPNQSLLICVEAQSCPAATELANFAAERLRGGDEPEEVARAVVEKYIQDHVSFTFTLKDTPKKGAENGPIVLVEYADFECPFCAEFGRILQEVVAANSKEITLYFKQFPIIYHEWALPAALATLAAHRQDRFWAMHDLIFDNQEALTEESFSAFARQLGLDTARFEQDRQDPALLAQIERDKQEAAEAQVQGTPSLFINGKPYLGERTAKAITSHIRTLLAKQPPKGAPPTSPNRP